MKVRYFCLIIAITTFSQLFSQGTKGGSVFYEQIRTLSFEERESAIEKEMIEGNMPSFINSLVTITTLQRDAGGREREVTLFVSPQYLSVGNDDDFFIVPMGPITAQRVADYYKSSLPTPKVTDIIYQYSRLKLEPFTYIPRGNRNETPDILYDHSKVIQAQIKAAGKEPGIFVAGIKKDIVICSKLADTVRTRHVTIYGWHKLDGKPIQPANNVHINTYVDYSHGVRLVSNRVLVDGIEYDYRDILKDSVLHKLLSYENEPLKRVSYIVGQVAKNN
ncbi:MAG TPA: hypothetical protein DF637_05900 [Rikenellaceae bacterium]|nr:hypothetical protein [Rikenellaceae bacterium]